MARTRPLRDTLLAGTALFWPAAVLAQPAPNAAPQGGTVAAGGITIQGTAGQTTINQSTQRGIIDWRSFDVGSQHTVQFNQPGASSVTLNRVTTPVPSQIAGRIQANGQVAIVNQSGVVFHRGATVDAAGLVVSTANIANEAFMRGGRMHFDQPGDPNARIENNGRITVREAGLAALVAPQVANRGTIVARAGRVVLAGAETSVVDLHGDGLLSLEIASPVRQAPTNGEALVTNTGTIAARGGTVVLTAQAVDGIVQDLVRAGGRIAANTDASGRTGRVVIAGTGGTVRIEGEVSAQGLAANTRGGTVDIMGDRNWVAPGATVNASGRAGGGTVRIGTNGRGNSATQVTRRSGIAQGATVRADATERGDGGTVLVNSTEYTAHAGTITARGGPQGGNGGFVEVSGHNGLLITGAVSVIAGPGRTNGTYLIDPDTLNIVADGDPAVNVTPADVADGILGAGDPPGAAFIAAGTVNAVAGDLVLQARTLLTVDSAVNKPTGGLTLQAGTSLVINAPIVLSGGDVLLQSSMNFGEGIRLGALVQVPGTNRITIDGEVTTTNTSGRFVGGFLNSVQPVTTQSLLNDNQIGTLENLETYGGAEFRNIGSLRVTGAVGGTSNSYVRIDVVGGDLVIDGTIRAGGGFGGYAGASTQLRASGNLTVNASGTVDSTGIRAQAGFNFATNAADPTAPGAMQLSGLLSNYSTSDPSTVELAAGTGGITQTQGAIRADRLLIQSGGDALLNSNPGSVSDGNLVNVIGPSTIARDFGFTGRSLTFATDMAMDGDIRVGRTADFTIRETDLTQLAGSRLFAETVNAQALVNGILLTGDNQIANIGTIIGEGTANIRNVISLRVNGSFESRSSAARIDVDGGDFTLAPGALVRGDASTFIRATGSITTGAGSVIENEPGSPPTILLSAGYDFASSATNPASPAGIFLGGRLGTADMTTAITLNAAQGGIVQSGGEISAGTLAVNSLGNALLAGADATTPNNVARLLPSRAAGDFALDNGTTPLQIDAGNFTARSFTFRTAGAIGLLGGANITATERVGFRSGSLEVGGGATPAAIAAPLVEIAPDANVAMAINTLAAPEPYDLTPVVLGQITASTLRLGAVTLNGVTTTTASGIRFPVNYAFPGTLDLRATGDVTQAAGTTLGAGTLTGIAGGSVILTGPANQLPVIGDLSAGSTISLVTLGSQALTGHVSAPGVALATGGDLTETGAGRISGGALVLQVPGDALLTGANGITQLGASQIGGNLRLANSSALLSVPLGNLVFTGGTLQLAQTGDLRVDGTVSGTTTLLTSTGAGQVNGNSAIARTGDLTINAGSFALNGLLQAAGAVRINASTLASLAGRVLTTGTLQVTAPAITFGGLDATLANVSLFLGGTGSTSGTIGAGALAVYGGSTANLFGTIAGITGGAAAAQGRRGTASGTPLAEPLPNANQFLFNNCPLGVAVCNPVVPPAPPPPTPPEPPPAAAPTPEPEPRPAGFIATAENQPAAAATLQPVPPFVGLLQAPRPNLTLRPFRDRAEAEEIGPPNIRGGDF
ncbi:beta strand repeat-containing protein [Roseococcus sp. YIM B11640]|uniref:beta strand repeat-containing protein n=1 Tax=Roseococcus sp. YIM B11640 TaxID=3133973 RepID=UPI003C7AFDEB